MWSFECIYLLAVDAVKAVHGQDSGEKCECGRETVMRVFE